jgi:hypothetical protein
MRVTGSQLLQQATGESNSQWNVYEYKKLNECSWQQLAPRPFNHPSAKVLYSHLPPPL